jgi:hypothetical protein
MQMAMLSPIPDEGQGGQDDVPGHHPGRVGHHPKREVPAEHREPDNHQE